MAIVSDPKGVGFGEGRAERPHGGRRSETRFWPLERRNEAPQID